MLRSRSRSQLRDNDQVACDLRLYLKDHLLGLHAGALDLAGALLSFAKAHQTVLWPGYTHQRRAMPSDRLSAASSR